LEASSGTAATLHRNDDRDDHHMRSMNFHALRFSALGGPTRECIVARVTTRRLAQACVSSISAQSVARMRRLGD